MANCLDNMGNHEDALAMKRGLVREWTAVRGSDDITTIANCMNLMLSFYRTRRYAEGVEFGTKQLAVTRRVLGPTHYQTIKNIEVLGLCIYFGARSEAEKQQGMAHIEDAISLATKTLGRDHPITGDMQNFLGIMRARGNIRINL